MSSELNDLLDWIEAELDREREAAARHVDRADALAQLRTRALPIAASLRRPLTPDDLFAAARDEHERAELRALADRATRGEPASANSNGAGTYVGSGVAF